MIKLTKDFSRERSMFYCHAWHNGDLYHFYEWVGFNFRNMLFVRRGNTNKVSIWCDVSQYDLLRKRLADRVNRDKNYFPKVKEKFYEYWKKLYPYLSHQKKIKNLEELESFYNNWMLWWAPMAMNFTLIDLENVSRNIKKEALIIRKKTEKYSPEGDNVYLSYFSKHYPRYRNLQFVLTPTEVFNLKNGNFNKKKTEEIRKRLKGWFLFNGQLNTIDKLNEVLRANGLELEEERVGKNVREIKGQAVCQGLGRGKVRLILYKKDVKKLKKGEILVTEMTTPDFFLSMKKSAAIITDEGGLTCHAAIVSRELNVPCIVGTKIATKALKDGDLVEVDANKGVVRIIKR